MCKIFLHVWSGSNKKKIHRLSSKCTRHRPKIFDRQRKKIISKLLSLDWVFLKINISFH